MNCPKCGKEITQKSIYCNHCGEKLKNTDEINKGDDKDNKVNHKKRGTMKVLVTLLLIFILFLMVAYNDERILASVIALLEIVLVISSLLLDKKIIKTKGDKTYIIPLILSLVLIIPYFSAYNITNYEPKEEKYEEYFNELMQNNYIDNDEQKNNDTIINEEYNVTIANETKNDENTDYIVNEILEGIDNETDDDNKEITENEVVLNIDNCPELSKILEDKSDSVALYEEFADKYYGRTIEFDGCVTNITQFEDYNTRYDVLVSFGDFDENHQSGPIFKFENVNSFDLGLTAYKLTAQLSTGSNIHIKAKVERYNENNGIFYLDPIEITKR